MYLWLMLSLDYCNSLFRSLSKFNLCKLQCILTSAAGIVSNNPQSIHQYNSFKNCIGFLLNSAQCLRQPHVFIRFFTQVFLGILLHIFLPTAVLIVPGAIKVVAISLSFQKFHPSVHKSLKQFGNSFAFDAPTVWNVLPDEIRASSPFLTSFRKQLKTYLYTKAYPLSLDSPWCLTPLLSLDTEIWFTAFLVLLCLRVFLYGENKCYKSPIRIRKDRFFYLKAFCKRFCLEYTIMMLFIPRSHLVILESRD